MYSGRGALAMQTRFQRSQDTMYSLAADTGGKAFLDSKEFKNIANKQDAQKLLSNSAFTAMAANSNFVTLLQNPAFANLATNASFVSLLNNSNLTTLLQTPAFVKESKWPLSSLRRRAFLVGT